MTIKNVGVIGCGLMGSGIVQVAAQAGFEVLFVEANDDLVKRGLGRLRETLEGLASRGKIEAKAKDKTAQAEIATVNSLKMAKQNIDRKLKDLKTTHDTHVARAKASIDADVAAFKASVNDFAAKFKTSSAKK